MKVEIVTTVHSVQEIEERLKEIATIKNRCNPLGEDYTVKIRYEQERVKACDQDS